MSLLVQKFGGTSVANVERIRNVAARAIRAHAAGHKVVVIVSAMSGETNKLLGLAHEVMLVPEAREMDVIAATGEQVSAALTAMAILAQGGKARSLLGHQVRILTDGAYTKARILSIDAKAIADTHDRGEIAVVAGFQGVDDKGNITTLGRGGSDTTAVAIAAAINADACEIYTDVDGVYTTDPNVCPAAKKIPRIAYDEMLELASLGAKVLQLRSVEIAMKYDVPVHVRSSFSDVEGTWVVAESKELESIVVRGVACDKNDARVHIEGVDDRVDAVARLFEALAEKNISVDMIVQNAAAASTGEAKKDVTFTLGKSDLQRAKPFIEEIAKELGGRGVRYDESVAKVSIVGLGMRSHAGVAAKMFRLLANAQVGIHAISTSEIRVSCLVAAKEADNAVRALHDGFGLSQG